MYAVQVQGNPIPPLCGALPVLYVPVRVTRGALVAHRNAYPPPRCRTSQYCRTFIPFSVSLLEWSWWSCVRWCGTSGFQEQGKCLFIGLTALSILCLLLFSLSLLSFYRVVLWGWVCGLIVLTDLSQPCIAGLFNNYNNNNNNNNWPVTERAQLMNTS